MALPFIVLLITFCVAVVLGVFLAYLSLWSQERQLIKAAQRQAADLLKDTKDAFEERFLEIEESEKEKLENLLQQLEDEAQPVLRQLKEKSDDLELQEEAIVTQFSGSLQELNDQLSQIGNIEKKLETKVQQVNSLIEDIQVGTDSYIQEILAQFKMSSDELIEMESIKLSQDYVRSTDLKLKADLEWVQEEAPTEAKKLISRALDRFQREHCPERGLGSVQYSSEKHKEAFLAEASPLLQTVQELCGVDIIVNRESNNVGFAGFDPVRRELTRRLLESIMKSRDLSLGWIKPKFERLKSELFKQIRNDGERLAKELRLKNLAPEIRQMMGCLRYRYSFSQNQYFHCIEVGWLCGLLAAELGCSTEEARRSGVLHDLGKSMDHSLDGGHAMIGADFIEKHGEAANIVHNVRAHHYDVQPATDVAFLVIGADALSGGRPGARRSTIESYNQKIMELESIGNSYNEVQATYIVNGGREVRIVVDGRRVNDAKSIQLAKKIALTIEETCSYPGSIKVVVMRESISSETTFASMPAS